MWQWRLLLIFIVHLVQIKAQLNSPCPQYFVYEPQTENDKWYGQITLFSETELTGVWLRIILDRPSIQLGNYFGSVRTTDNIEYLIMNREIRLEVRKPMVVRFFIKYDPNQPAPQLKMFRLNAKTICPIGVNSNPITIKPNMIFVSALSEDSGNNAGNQNEQGQSATIPPPNQLQMTSIRPERPVTWFPGANFGEDDSVFQGDFTTSKGVVIPSTLDRCGSVVKQPRPLITYGQESSEGEFPWHAALYHAKGSNLNYICGATLISRQHLITVAHCITRTKTQMPLNPESMLVYLGKYYLKRWTNTGIQDKHVEQIIPHPEYSSQTFRNDIAIVKLSEPAEITDFVRPICLWGGDTNLKSVVDKLGVVAGWGFNEKGIITEKLTKANMPVVTQEKCIYSFPDFFSRFTSSNTYCAGFRNGTSVCNGDSGGGMVFPVEGSNPNNPTWQLRGMVSISVALQNQFKCDASQFVVFTDTAKYLPWIKSNLV